jgi:trehalose 6-phosphate synthase
MWTRQSLHELIANRLKGYKFIVVANRAPYLHRYKEGRIEVIAPASGMATALDPVIRASGGVWIGHGAGDADRAVVDARCHVRVPPGEDAYDLRLVWLTKEQEEGYYYGLANEGLWPLCHIAFTPPEFNPAHWERYKEVNEIFARAVIEEAAGEPAIVFVQDYHFCLLPKMVKAMGGDKLTVAQFWHIPWPNPEAFRVFPWKEELLEGLLGNDLLGFHIRYHCQNFLDTVDRFLECRLDRERFDIVRGGKTTMVRPFPISIDYQEYQDACAGAGVRANMGLWRVRHRLEGMVVGASVERLDYTKGIPNRLKAIDLFFAQHPEWIGRLVFVQVADAPQAHVGPDSSAGARVLVFLIVDADRERPHHGRLPAAHDVEPLPVKPAFQKTVDSV